MFEVIAKKGNVKVSNVKFKRNSLSAQCYINVKDGIVDISARRKECVEAAVRFLIERSVITYPILREY